MSGPITNVDDAGSVQNPQITGDSGDENDAPESDQQTDVQEAQDTGGEYDADERTYTVGDGDVDFRHVAELMGHAGDTEALAAVNIGTEFAPGAVLQVPASW